MDWSTLYQDNHEVIIGGTFTLIGIFIGWLLNLIQSYFQEKREQQIHLREKREDVYLKVLDVLTRHEKCYREKHVSIEEYEEYKKAYNDLQSYMMLYASPKIYKEYYKNCNEITECYVKIKKRTDRERMLGINADKIELFAYKMRKELGIKN